MIQVENDAGLRRWWIQEPRLLATSNPTDAALARLRRAGFATIVSLLDESKEPPNYNIGHARDQGWTVHTMPVAEGRTPSDEQIDRFVALFGLRSAYRKTILHCQTGGSRTAVMAAAYWVSQGLPVIKAIDRLPRHDEILITDERRDTLERFAVRRATASVRDVT